MKIIKEITQGEFRLVHAIVLDDFGFERSDFTITKTEKSGKLICKSFLAPIRVTESSGDYADDVRPYTDEQYAQMMEEEKF